MPICHVERTGLGMIPIPSLGEMFPCLLHCVRVGCMGKGL